MAHCTADMSAATCKLCIMLFIMTIHSYVFILSISVFPGSAQVSSDGQVEFKPLAGIRYMWWYHLFGLIWTSEFFLTCQHIVISGVTASRFLHRYVIRNCAYFRGGTGHALIFVHCLF